MFDVAVVIPTILRPSLVRAVESVLAQDLDGTVQILIGVDASAGDRSLLDDVAAGAPDRFAVTVVDPGYSTSVRHGGLHAARDCGALRATLSYLANSPRIAYLDDDNWWAPDHLSSLLEALGGFDWAYSKRWFVRADNRDPIAVDEWESTGPDCGIFTRRFGGFVDPNCLMIDAVRC